MKLIYLIIFPLFSLTYLLIGCEKSTENQVKELGFYAVVDGEAMNISFKEYGSGGTSRSLKLDDFPVVPVLLEDDYLLFYGDMTNFEIFSYKRNGPNFQYNGEKFTNESFFVQEPLEPIRGVKLTKLSPKSLLTKGIYFIHKYVGLRGDAYLPFRIESNDLPRSEAMSIILKDIDSKEIHKGVYIRLNKTNDGFIYSLNSQHGYEFPQYGFDKKYLSDLVTEGYLQKKGTRFDESNKNDYEIFSPTSKIKPFSLEKEDYILALVAKRANIIISGITGSAENKILEFDIIYKRNSLGEAIYYDGRLREYGIRLLKKYEDGWEIATESPPPKVEF